MTPWRITLKFVFSCAATGYVGFRRPVLERYLSIPSSLPLSLPLFQLWQFGRLSVPGLGTLFPRHSQRLLPLLVVCISAQCTRLTFTTWSWDLSVCCREGCWMECLCVWSSHTASATPILCTAIYNPTCVWSCVWSIRLHKSFAVWLAPWSLTLSLACVHMRALLLVSLGFGYPASLVQSVQHVCSHFPRKPIIGPGLTTGFISAMRSWIVCAGGSVCGLAFGVICYTQSHRTISCYFRSLIAGYLPLEHNMNLAKSVCRPASWPRIAPVESASPNIFRLPPLGAYCDGKEQQTSET